MVRKEDGKKYPFGKVSRPSKKDEQRERGEKAENFKAELFSGASRGGETGAGAKKRVSQILRGKQTWRRRREENRPNDDQGRVLNGKPEKTIWIADGGPKRTTGKKLGDSVVRCRGKVKIKLLLGVGDFWELESRLNERKKGSHQTGEK